MTSARPLTVLILVALLGGPPAPALAVAGPRPRATPGPSGALATTPLVSLRGAHGMLSRALHVLLRASLWHLFFRWAGALVPLLLCALVLALLLTHRRRRPT